MLARLSPAALIVVEGYKRESIPKIEVRRREAVRSDPFASSDPAVIAIAADHPVADAALPTFDLDDIGGMADFVVATFRLGAGAER